VHKLEKFVDDSFEKLPVGLKETRILTYNVHDIGGNNSLVVLAPFLNA
jgi:hypothetical protein